MRKVIIYPKRGQDLRRAIWCSMITNRELGKPEGHFEAKGRKLSEIAKKKLLNLKTLLK